MVTARMTMQFVRVVSLLSFVFASITMIMFHYAAYFFSFYRHPPFLPVMTEHIFLASRNALFAHDLYGFLNYLG